MDRPSLLRWTANLALTSSSGLFVVALGYSANRAGESWASLAFWIGILLIFVPCTARLLSRSVSRPERIGNLIVLTLGLYLVKVLHSPTSFTFYDELLHWRTTEDILLSGALFTRNPLLPISGLYPGLETVASTLISLSGLSVFQAGVIIIGLVKLVLVLSLFLFYERVSRSAWVASLGVLFYATNPAFVFFDAQFGYESLALAFGVGVLWIIVRRQQSQPRRLAWGLVGVGAVAALTVTHHLSSYLTATYLLIWALVPFVYYVARALLFWYGGFHSLGQVVRIARRELRQFGYALVGRRGRNVRRLPLPIALFALAGAIFWVVTIADVVVAYIGTYLLLGVDQIFKVVLQESQGRQLFHGYAGEVAPAWEQIVTYLAILLVVFMLMGGVWVLLRRGRRNLAMMTLTLVAMSYPVTLGLRLTDFGLQISSRLVEFLFVGVSFVLAFVVISVQLSKRRIAVPVLRLPLLLGVITIIFVGGVIIGWPNWARLPGSYQISADTRSIENEGLSAASWMRDHEGIGNNVAADRINSLLLGSYGEQVPLSLSYDNDNVPLMFLEPAWNAPAESVLRTAPIDFVVADYRLTRGLPFTGFYFELGEPDANRHTEPLAPVMLDKFADAPLPTNRVYDSGDVVIWQVIR